MIDPVAERARNRASEKVSLSRALRAAHQADRAVREPLRHRPGEMRTMPRARPGGATWDRSRSGWVIVMSNGAASGTVSVGRWRGFGHDLPRFPCLSRSPG